MLGPPRSGRANTVVIGGGLAGLTAAHGVASVGERVSLLEASSLLGGQLRTERADDCIVEHGAEGFVSNSEAVAALATVLGIHAEIIEQAASRSLGFDGKALRPLAPGQAGSFLGLHGGGEDLGQGLHSFRDGMASLTEAIAHDLARRGVPIVASTPVDSVERTGERLRVHTSDGSPFPADHVVVATSAQAAANLLEPLAGDAALALGDAPTASSVTVTLAHTRRQVTHPLDASGFVVEPDVELHTARACTFVTSKFAGRAPEEVVLLRVFFRPEPGELATVDEMGWIERARSVVREVLDVNGMTMRSWVSRWTNALPAHTPEYGERVAALERALEGSGVVLAGAAFHGSGVDTVVRSAERAAAVATGALAPPS